LADVLPGSKLTIRRYQRRGARIDQSMGGGGLVFSLAGPRESRLRMILKEKVIL
jgi:hypothetical protein